MKRTLRNVVAIAGVIGLMAAAFMAGQLRSFDDPAVATTASLAGTDATTQGAGSSQAMPLRADGSSLLADLAERVSPGVVFIQTTRTANNSRQRSFDFFRDMLPDRGQEQQRGRRMPGGGSGFIIDDEGRILTNHHVIRDADDVTVVVNTPSGEKEFDAEVVGEDPRTDIAIIQINAPRRDLTVVQMGDSDAMRVGDYVMAIGTPFGQLRGSVTAGIVSAKGRTDLQIASSEAVFQNYIQTDASINFGNSGGPLLNMNGEAIGINTAINPSGQGIGFAIPINMAKAIMGQLIADGRVRYGFIGISLQELDADLAAGMGLDVKRGILVREVMKGFPAEKAGIEARDVIVEYNGQDVREDGDFRLKVGSTPIGERVPLVVLRDGKRKKLTIEIGERPDEGEIAQGAPGGGSQDAWLGLVVDDAGDDDGVVVTEVEVGSPADEAGIREGDVIVEVFAKSVAGLSDYGRIADDLKDRKAPIAFLVKRGRTTIYIPVIPED